MHSRQPFHTETRRHHQCTGFKTDQFFAEKRIITCKVYHAKVLKGVGNNHSLPDYAHTKSSIYIKENTNGSFREMRIYDPDDGHVVLEIAYHPEPTLTGNRTTRILHYHRYDKDLKHGAAKVLTKLSDIYEKYKKYLEAYGL